MNQNQSRDWRKICLRGVAAVAFVALAVTGWDAEAGWRRHHRQASCCYEPVCCAPVCDPCCRPVCETVCDPCRVSTCAPVCVTRVVEPVCCSRIDCGCSTCSVVRETVVVPATVCCGERIVATERTVEARVVTADAPTATGTAARSVVVRNVSTTTAPAPQATTAR